VRASHERSARGRIFHVRDGTVDFKVVASNLPGEATAAHIYQVAPDPRPIIQALPPTPGAENGVIATGSFTNPDLVADIQADPDNFYVYVHSSVCGVAVCSRFGPLSGQPQKDSGPKRPHATKRAMAR
jgi:hypothetical protein